MTIYKRNIAWATMTLEANRRVSYQTDDCGGVAILVFVCMGELSYAVTREGGFEDGPMGPAVPRLTPQAWAAIRADVKGFI